MHIHILGNKVYYGYVAIVHVGNMKCMWGEGYLIIYFYMSFLVVIKDAVQTVADPRTIAVQQHNDHDVPGSSPRDVSQVSYYRKKLRKVKQSDDEFEDILFYSSKVGKYCIRNLQFNNKALRFVFVLDVQLDVK